MDRRMKEKGLGERVVGMVQRTQRDSNDEKVGMEILEQLMEERWIRAMPPPLPTSLDELIIEKSGGQRLRSKEG